MNIRGKAMIAATKRPLIQTSAVRGAKNASTALDAKGDLLEYCGGLVCPR